MATCPYCGTENQTGAVFCTSCGSNLNKQQQTAAPPARSYGSGTSSSFDMSQRYERALKRVEQLGLYVVILAVATVILVLI